jgi:hypothetical protein
MLKPGSLLAVAQSRVKNDESVIHVSLALKTL